MLGFLGVVVAVAAFILVMRYVERNKETGGKMYNALAWNPSGDQKRVLGGILLVIGIIATLFGFVRLNSASSQLMSVVGREDSAAYGAIGLGAVAAIIGVILLMSKPPSSNAD